MGQSSQSPYPYVLTMTVSAPTMGGSTWETRSGSLLSFLGQSPAHNSIQDGDCSGSSVMVREIEESAVGLLSLERTQNSPADGMKRAGLTHQQLSYQA